MSDCIFCKIAQKQAPAHVIWEDEKHMAFLSIFPNTEGFSVVIPKEHHSSYFAEVDQRVIQEFIVAVQKVAKLLDSKLDDVGRTAMMFEGFGVDHLHAKLFPMHGTANMETWKPLHSGQKKYFSQYEGYISSHDFERADDEKLAALAKKIKN